MTPCCDAHKCANDADSWVIVAGRAKRLCSMHVDRARVQVGDGVTVLYDTPLDGVPEGASEADTHPACCVVPGCLAARKAWRLCQRHYGAVYRACELRPPVGLDEAALIRLALRRPSPAPKREPKPKAPRKRPPTLRERLAAALARVAELEAMVGALAAK